VETQLLKCAGAAGDMAKSVDPLIQIASELIETTTKALEDVKKDTCKTAAEKARMEELIQNSKAAQEKHEARSQATQDCLQEKKARVMHEQQQIDQHEKEIKEKSAEMQKLAEEHSKWLKDPEILKQYEEELAEAEKKDHEEWLEQKTAIEAKRDAYLEKLEKELEKDREMQEAAERRKAEEAKADREAKAKEAEEKIKMLRERAEFEREQVRQAQKAHQAAQTEANKRYEAELGTWNSAKQKHDQQLVDLATDIGDADIQVKVKETEVQTTQDEIEALETKIENLENNITETQEALGEVMQYNKSCWWESSEKPEEEWKRQEVATLQGEVEKAKEDIKSLKEKKARAELEVAKNNKKKDVATAKKDKAEKAQLPAKPKMAEVKYVKPEFAPSEPKSEPLDFDSAEIADVTAAVIRGTKDTISGTVAAVKDFSKNVADAMSKDGSNISGFDKFSTAVKDAFSKDEFAIPVRQVPGRHVQILEKKRAEVVKQHEDGMAAHKKGLDDVMVQRQAVLDGSRQSMLEQQKLLMQQESEIADLKGEIAKSVQIIQNSRANQSELERAIVGLGLALQSLGKIHYAFGNVKTFWQLTQQHCEKIAKKELVEDIKVYMEIEEPIFDQIDELLKNWAVLGSQNLMARNAIAAANENVGEFFQDIPIAANREEYIQDKVQGLQAKLMLNLEDEASHLKAELA